MVDCPRCGYQNSEAARFCSSCGASLSSVTAPGEERKVVSALFVDVVGSTARAQAADPEDVRDFLRRFHRPVKDQVERYGGTIEKFIGDAVLAIFGAPTSHGDDAERAVLCGLAVVEAIDDLNAADPDIKLSVRIAVSTGEAVVTLGHAHERGEVLATGDVLNTAARLQAAAPPGRVVVGAATYQATRRAIDYEPMLAVHAKGKADPVEAWLAIAPMSGPRSSAPMVGREGELAALQGAFTRAVEVGRPQMVTIMGPAGIGKTRLALELLRYVDKQGGRLLRGRCLPYAEQAGYQASVQHVKELAGILESDAPDLARTKLLETVTRFLPAEDVTEVAHFLSLFIGLGIDEPVVAREPLFYAVRKLIQAVCTEQPTLFAFEDLHWADASQLELLNYLCGQLRDVSLMFLVTARPELEDKRPPLDASRFEPTRLVLEPLSASDSASLVARLVAATPAAEANIGRLVELAAGNPLFLEELAASTSLLGTQALPTNVHEAIAAHIDALPEAERTVLLDASVVGPTFWREVVSAIEGGNPGLEASLDALVARGIIRRSARSVVAGEVQFAFKHALVREVAYQTLTRAARRSRHAAVARHLETVLGGDLRTFAGVLAHHWREALENAKAIDYLLMAAERATAAWAATEVAALFQTAVELAAGGNPAVRNQIRLKGALASVQLTEFEAAAAELRALLPDLEGRERLEGLMALTMSLYWLEDVAEAVVFADQGLELAQTIADPELAGPAMAHAGLSREGTGELAAAFELYERARKSWVPGTRQMELAMLTEQQSDLAYWLGDHAGAERLAGAAHELGREVHSVNALLRGGAWRGLAIAAQGRSEEALEWLDGIFETAQELNPRWGAATLNYSSLAFRDMFMFDEARRRNEQALAIVAARGAWGMPELHAEIDLLVTDLAVGDVGRVQRTFARIWDAAINGKAWRPWLGGTRLALVRAELARATEGPEATAGYARDALERATRTHRPKYEAASRAILGSALVESNLAAEGIAQLRAAAEIADRVGSPGPRWQHRAALARALSRTADDAGAEAVYREAEGIVRDYAARLKPEHAHVFLGVDPVREVLKASGSI